MQTLPNAQSKAARRDLWLIRLYYLMLGGGGFIQPFMGLFFIRADLTGTQIGLITTVASLATLIAAPIWGRWSDSADHPRRLLQIALIGNALIFLAISQQGEFVWLAWLFLVQGWISAGLAPLSDTLALAFTRTAGFGSIRLWASMGWAVIVVASGLLIERFGLIAGFVGYAASLFLAAGVVNGISDAPEQRSVGSLSRQRTSTRAVIRSLLGEPALVGLALALGILTLSGRGVAQFEPIFLDQLGASEFWIGMASTIGATTELPAMLWADRLVQRHGAGRVLRLGIAISMIRMALVFIAPGVALILAMRVVEGIAFSMTAVALVTFISRRAPQQQRAMALALYGVTLGSLVSMAAGPLSGALFDAAGAKWLYLLALAGNILAWLVLTVTYRQPRTPAAS